jgi:ubiquinone/menaquinone biosynthesis C-methylase UbiE
MTTEGRPGIWEYYDRRAGEGPRTFDHALAYWTGLGVDTTAEEIQQEAQKIRRLLRSMMPASFVEVGAGPGTFTTDLPGWGVALDQSETALRVLRSGAAHVGVVRGDAFELPFANRAVDRVFAAHIYGLLELDDRCALLGETRRIARQLVIIDAGRPQGVPAEHFQSRTLGNGDTFTVFRRHFEGEELAAEIDGQALFVGRFYILAST